MLPSTKSTDCKTSLKLKEHCFKWEIDNWNASSFLESLQSQSFAIPDIKASLEMSMTIYSQFLCVSVSYDDSIYLRKCNIDAFIICKNQNIRLQSNRSCDSKNRNGKPIKIAQFISQSLYTTENAITIMCKIKYALSISEDSVPYEDKMTSSNFGKLFSEKKFYDVVLLAGKERISAHIAVLAAVSPYFFAMFDNPVTKENQKRIVDFSNDKDITADNLRGFLEYIYGGKSIGELSSMVSDLLILADKFGVEQLRKTCECYMSERIDKENVVDTLILSDKYHCQFLKKKALSFAKMHIDVIKESKKFNELIKIEDFIRNLL